MPQLSVHELHDVSETLLLPLYFRAVENQRADALLSDPMAADLVAQLDYDFAQVRIQAFEQVATLMRTREFDRCARTFLAQHPAGLVVNIGCGLDTRFHRVDNGSVTWYDLDLPEVMLVRRKLIEHTSRNRFLGCSALDTSWMNAIRDTNQHYLFLAEGVLPYWTEAEVRHLIRALGDRFPGAEVVFDAMSPLLVHTHNRELARSGINARLRWGLKRDEDVEAWAPDFQLLERWYYFDKPEPRLGWLRLLRFLPPLGRGNRILHYRLGKRG